LTDFARDGGLARASVAVVEGDAASIAFAEHRGLVPTGGGQLGALDLATATRQPPPALPDGVTVTTLAERPELERAIYELDLVVRPEIPALAGEPDPTYEAWQAEMTSDEGFLRDLCLIAVRDEAVVGVIQVYDDGEGKVFIGMTAVDPGSRRLGLARALKQILAQRAAASGYHRIETYNDGTNERIRGLNESLGYVYWPRMVILKGPLPAPASAAPQPAT
jgi:ribosomal protein S18 acetylase RimI-like enzyme